MSEPMVDTGMRVESIKMSEIYVDPEFNCRGDISPIEVIDLVKSIERDGLLQPVVIMKSTKPGFPYKLLCGFRRHMAHIVLKKSVISAVIRNDIDDIDCRILNLTENLKRSNLSIAQEAKAINHLKQSGLTEFEVADRLGVSRGWIQVRFLFLKLPEPVQDEIEIGAINQTQIRDLYSVFKDDGEDACLLAAKAVKEAKQKGKSINLRIIKNKDGKVRDKKSRRTSGELQLMQETIRELFGNGLTTKILAWANGHLRDTEIHAVLAEYAKKYDKVYIMPKFK